ncbi:phosphate/phosphite/phosphonate ABC transporter substrate-binding protein [Aestuariibius sp. HNIBRBA575]|uniref:phosphate/phosphite/phosphonate ABC transporter substrate-binding protein n=1 Tax=Aestuariibius sp. HNIBRBA575 TaxID=3233343 RepID=UPI0034A182E7
MTPMARYLETELADFGITEVQIRVETSSVGMISALQSNEVDLYFDSPLVAAHVARSAGAVPFLRRWKRGEASYHSLIIVPTDSDIHDLRDLVGQRIGFQEPDSTSGFLLPVDMLLDARLPLRELVDRTENPDEDEIGYVFTEDDKNTLLWLARGWIAAGATDPRRWAQLNEARPGAFRIIATSVEVPRQVVVRRGGLDAALSLRISDVLQDMSENEETSEILEQFHKTSRFDEFPRGVAGTFDPIYTLLDRLAAADLI